MRFLIEVDEQWRVVVRRPGSDFEKKRSMGSCTTVASSPADGTRYPLPPSTDAAAMAELPGDGSPGAIAAAHNEIRDRRPTDSAVFGRYLFHCLLGDELWRAIESEAAAAELLELALGFPAGRDPLQTLPWEMMHGPGGFLVAGAGRKVAMTRLVSGSSGVPRTFPGLTRLLFVVGTSLDDRSIRPGAEYLGLLRQLELDGQVLFTRVLERASASRLSAAVASFRPDVVHFICHGGIDFDDRGYLELVTDETDEPAQRNAEQILGFLRGPAGDLPPVAVLSSCDSGSLLAPEKSMPLAAELVLGGIPVVVGMAGRVADRACRLFTRRFGQALVRGESLVAATEEGRRAAFAEGESPRTTVDWALPTLFLSPKVPAGYAPVDSNALAAAHALEERVRLLDVRRKPVFCGRHQLVEDFHHLLDSPGASVLLVLAKDSRPGLGRTRLLQELAAQALMDGHLPVLISGESPGWRPPATALDLGLQIYDAILRLRTEVLGLGEGAASDLDLLAAPGFDPLDPPGDLPRWMGRLLREGEISAELVRKVVENDLVALLAEARARFGADPDHPTIRGAVVLLDDVDRYDEALKGLFDQMLKPQGLGPITERVPVVLSLSLGTAAGPMLAPHLERLRSKRWVISRYLAGFRQGEDMLAYERVLLHPFADDSTEGISARPWQMDFDSDPRLVETYEGRYRGKLDQIPADFRNDIFFMISDFAREDDFLREADDEAILRRMRGGG